MAAHGSLGRSIGWILFGLVILAGIGLYALESLVPEGAEDDLLRVMGLEKGTPERHLIPEGYAGWLTIKYGVADAPPLEMDGEAAVFRYPESGALETSTEWNPGLRAKEYLDYGPNGLVPLVGGGPGRQIWESYEQSDVLDPVAGESRVVRSGGFFIGTQEEYASAGPSPAYSLPGLQGLNLDPRAGSGDFPAGVTGQKEE